MTGFDATSQGSTSSGARRPGLARRLAGWVLAAALTAVSLASVAPPAAAQAQGTVLANRLELRTATATHSFSLEIADTDAKRAEGLMFRTEMAPDHGMLFDFKREEPVWFWMKNTYLPLDMIFAKADGTILSIAENTTPLSEATVPSGGPVRFVFEVVAGTAKRLAIKPGDHLIHPRMRPAP